MAGKLFMFFFLVMCLNSEAIGHKLEQVIILSRHNLRTPLAESLLRITPYEWPKWKSDVGLLTPKGALLESYMGEYFAAWLKREGLLPERCPDVNSVFIYANTKERTKDTAEAFRNAAFHNCNVPVHFKNITEMDPVFNPIIHNDSQVFKEIVTREMEEKIHSLNLRDVFEQLNDIADIKNSKACIEGGYCDLTEVENKVALKTGSEPDVHGPLTIGNKMLDTFLMSYYNGFPSSEIGWGKITNDTQWRSLTQITKQNQNVRFNTTTGARDYAKPLLRYIKNIKDTKFTLLVGHDSNLTPVMSALGCKSFELPEQFELTPIGSKLVFQKWSNGSRELLKVEFVYQSSLQLRNSEPLSLSNPPKNITMYLNDCIADKHGYCPWSDFEKILNDLVD